LSFKISNTKFNLSRGQQTLLVKSSKGRSRGHKENTKNRHYDIDQKDEGK